MIPINAEKMSNKPIRAGFIGAGGIARSHSFSLNSLKYYYNDAPPPELTAVCSATEKSRRAFASQYGFGQALSAEDFFSNKEINTVYILGPNKVHYEHLRKAIQMPSIERIYLEKPVCSTIGEEEGISALINDHPDIKIQVGFQYLFMTAIREALVVWKTGKAGRPVHFDLKYYHSDYLQKSYRDKRSTRLTPPPDGGAMADLGSHAISLLMAFLGTDLSITGAMQACSFPDVDPLSDLFSLISLYDNNSGAAGTLSASRIASGSGDMLNMELYAEKGALRFSSYTPDYFEYYLEETASWNKIFTGSSYKNITSFPSGHVPPGWLRAMTHAHYVFLTDNNQEPFIPDIRHGLEVQRIVRETAERLRKKGKE